MGRSLQGRTAIVTGGSRGISAGIALKLGKRGTNVLITYNKAGAQVDEMKNEFRKTYNAEAIGVQAGGSDQDSP